VVPGQKLQKEKVQGLRSKMGGSVVDVSSRPGPQTRSHEGLRLRKSFVQTHVSLRVAE
jgi:hypothetical protein